MKNRTFTKLLASVIFIAISPLASATPWTIDSVLNGTDGGFGYSSFHNASGGNPMSGSSYGGISNVGSGSYDDVSGAFSGSFAIGGDTFTLIGNMLFSSNYLAGASTLAIDFATGTTNLIDTTIGFMPGDICCNGNANGTPGLDPNSFDASTGILTLWGANGFVSSGTNVGTYYVNETLGMDIRLQLSQVPEPGMLMLLGMGLLGLGLRRRRI